MIDKNLWTRFYELYRKYAAGYEKYSEAEISFELDEIAGGLLPTLLENLFNAWFPELKEVGNIDYMVMKPILCYGMQFLQKSCIIILIVPSKIG